MSDNLSGLPATLRGHSHADGAHQPTDKVGSVCFILVCLHALFFGYIVVAYGYIAVAYDSIYGFDFLREDGPIENLTFAAFLLGSVMLFAAALADRRLLPRCAYVLGGMALLFFGGEEISWGQRIIEFKTPDFMADLNIQGEFNIHNIEAVQYGVVTLRKQKAVIFMLCLAACAAFFARKNRVLGIPSPSIPLTLALLITMSHFYRIYDDTIRFENLTLYEHRGLFLLLLMVALLSSRSARALIAIAASFSVSLYADYTFHHSWSYHAYPINFDELSEYLLSVCCFFYALHALLDQRAARQKIASLGAAFESAAALPSIRRVKTPPRLLRKSFIRIRGGFLTPWTSVCALIIASSIGLALMTYLHYKADAAAFEETRLLTRTMAPVARSNLDMYIDGHYLHYFKQPCVLRHDLRTPLFLGVFPQNVDDLPVERRAHGFENLDFRFGQYGGMLDGACAAKVRLPAYEIARVSTGQYTSDEYGVATSLWIAEFPVKYRADAAAFEETLSLTQTVEPVARSYFDVYIDGRYLHYFRQSCTWRSDLKAPFFLGVFPQNVDDLPVDRRPHGFENLDFRFEQYGGTLDGACAAKVRLPGYEIASVSTGQYTSDEYGVATNLWIAEFPVNK